MVPICYHHVIHKQRARCCLRPLYMKTGGNAVTSICLPHVILLLWFPSAFSPVYFVGLILNENVLSP